ncbi:MAG TPA: hypothetical protein VK066_18005 [Chloroflexota bacterium]|nr:hypothetical protein [Chloroflexota bacterium]
MHRGRFLGPAGLAAALAISLSAAGALAAPLPQTPAPDGGSSIPQSGDQMATGSQPALPSCAERNDNGSNLGPATGPVTSDAPGTDATTSQAPGTPLSAQGGGPGALPVTGPGTAAAPNNTAGARNSTAPGEVIGVSGPAVDNLGAATGPGTAGAGPDALRGPIPPTCANTNTNQFSGGNQ